MGMVNFNFTKIILMLGIIFCYASCVTKQNTLFELHYRSPYGCVHQFIVNDNGDGIIRIGTEKQIYDDKINYVEIIKEENFIMLQEDMLNIKNLVNQNFVPIIKKPVNDGFRYSLIFKGEKKIDVYGSSTIEIDSILSISLKKISFKIDPFCEKYNNQENIK